MRVQRAVTLSVRVVDRGWYLSSRALATWRQHEHSYTGMNPALATAASQHNGQQVLRETLTGSDTRSVHSDENLCSAAKRKGILMPWLGIVPFLAVQWQSMMCLCKATQREMEQDI